jgi:hypothetical protein
VGPAAFLQCEQDRLRLKGSLNFVASSEDDSHVFLLDFAAMEFVFGEFGDDIPVFFVGNEFFPFFEASSLPKKGEFIAEESRFDL